MKAGLLISTLLLSSAAFATTAADVCMRISNSGLQTTASQCFQAIQGAVIADSVADLCLMQANSGLYNRAIECLRAGRGTDYVNQNALAICSRINMSGLYDTANDCLSHIIYSGNSYFDDGASGICQTIANSGLYSDAVTCLTSIREKSYDSRMVSLCRTVANSGLYVTSISCLNQLANRVPHMGFEVCENTAASGLYDQAVDCALSMSVPGYPASQQPTPFPAPSNDSSTCYVKETNQMLKYDEFFNRVSQYAQQHQTCATAKVTGVSRTGRIYNVDGRRIAKDRGGLSNSEVDTLLSQLGFYGCARFTCDTAN